MEIKKLTPEMSEIGYIPLWNKEDVAIVDFEDLERVSQFKWSWTTPGYAFRSIWGKEKQKGMLMHRFIMNAPDGTVLDHINGCKTDNRKSNLRYATTSQNMANVKKRSGTTSKYKGVTWSKRDKKWEAFTSKDRRTIHFGMFNTEEEAAQKYNEEAPKYHGEFARLNIIQWNKQ